MPLAELVNKRKRPPSAVFCGKPMRAKAITHMIAKARTQTNKRPVCWRDGRTIYHTLGCHYIERTDDDGLLRVGTVDEVFHQMLKPCRRCRPPKPTAWLAEVPEIPYRRVGRNSVEIVCPYCGERHYHGHPSDEYQITGYRAAHCECGGQYRLSREVEQ